MRPGTTDGRFSGAGSDGFWLICGLSSIVALQSNFGLARISSTGIHDGWRARCVLASCLLASCLLARCLLASCLLARCLLARWGLASCFRLIV